MNAHGSIFIVGFLRQKLVKMHGSERRRVSASVSQDPGAFDEDRDVTNDQEEKLVEGPSRHDSDYEEVSPSQVAIDLSVGFSSV